MHTTILTFALAVMSQTSAEPAQNALENWPQWRGPLGTGVSPSGNPPVEWSEDNNVRWKVELPGRGHSTPIIWGTRIFLTAAVPFGPKLEPRKSGRPGAHDNLAVSQKHRFVALAIDRQTGKTLWQKTLKEALPVEGAHYTASLASASPVADSKHIFAFFGSHGLFCLDHAGVVVWQKNLGRMHTKHGHGEGASPALHGSTLIVNWDHEDDSFIVAFDKDTGKERWRKQREKVTSWATPIVVEQAGKAQVIVCGTSRVRGYDFSDGSVLWECGGLSANIVATPVYSDGIVIAGSSYEKRAMLAIQLDGASGDITDSDRIIWSRRRGTPYVPSSLLYDNALYFHAHTAECQNRRREARPVPPAGHQQRLCICRRCRWTRLRNRHRRDDARFLKRGQTQNPGPQRSRRSLQRFGSNRWNRTVSSRRKLSLQRFEIVGHWDFWRIPLLGRHATFKCELL
jgi:outer membrane protein assembly factor BamB